MLCESLRQFRAFFYDWHVASVKKRCDRWQISNSTTEPNVLYVDVEVIVSSAKNLYTIYVILSPYGNST